MQKYFEDFYNANDGHLEKAEKNQIKVWNNEKVDTQPLLLSCSLSDEQKEKMTYYNQKEIHYDNEKMMLSSMPALLEALNGQRESIPSLRANMGCGIYSTLLGTTQIIYEDKMPWVLKHLDKDTINKIDIENIKISEEFQVGLNHIKYFNSKLTGCGVKKFPMDVQGIFDTAHIAYGDKIFYDMYDDPAFIHRLMEITLRATIVGIETTFDVLENSDKKIYHYNNVVIPRTVGGIKLSEDTTTLLSKDQIQEFAMPYTDRLLEHFGGGYIHYCRKTPY